MKRLNHNGVIVLPKYQGNGLTVKVRGRVIHLSDEQEEMAIAWAKKIGTAYVEDSVFAMNFHEDFSKRLGIEVRPGDIDFSEVLRFVENDREWKANLTREEKKWKREERKVIRETNKEKFGWAIVDGIRMEIGNYTVEPSSIFMGRGKHPLRGRWKEGPRQKDIELNLSPDAPKPLGNWKAIVWKPNTLWIARWRDKLSSKMKYVWPSDSSHLKQEKDIEKFETAKKLGRNLRKVKRHISENLSSLEYRRKKTATVAFLIDYCKFRVGDEKDEEEADTVGASTLRPEHVRFNGDGTVTFDFLGKDSVRHNICIEVPEQVIINLKGFSAETKTTLFNGVDSKKISNFLDEVMIGLSSKVFRTHYASTTVESMLKNRKVDLDDPEYYKKHIAIMANLEAAKICNHKRTIPKTWESSLQKKKDRLSARRIKTKENERKLKNRIKETEKKHKQKLLVYEQKLKNDLEKLEEYKKQRAEKKKQGKSVKGLEKRIISKQTMIKNQKDRIRKLKEKHSLKVKKLKGQMDNRKTRDKAAVDKLRLQIKAQEETRDYNLNTSLKSYIDPRIYFDWGKRVEYDWKKYYPKALRNKFSWVEANNT